MSQHTLDVLMVSAIVVGVTSTILGIALAFGWLFHQNWGIPAYKRELEATYASFHRFLMTVQAVVVSVCRSNRRHPVSPAFSSCRLAEFTS